MHMRPRAMETVVLSTDMLIRIFLVLAIIYKSYILGRFFSFFINS